MYICDIPKKVLIKPNAATDESNRRNETWH